MRIFMVLGLLAAPALALPANEDTSEQAKEAAKAAGQDVRQGAREVGQEAQQAGRSAEQEMQQAGRSANRQAQQAGRSAKQGAQGMWDEELFSWTDNYEVEGKVQKVSKNRITVQREELPPAEIHVAKRTNVQIDGERASLQQIEQGQDVHVSFNLRGDTPVAIEVEVDTRGIFENEPRDDEPGVGRTQQRDRSR